MRVVRSEEHRTYRADGNRSATHDLTFDLKFESARAAPGTIGASVDFRSSGGRITVNRLRLDLGSTHAEEGHKGILELENKLSVMELAEFAEGLKAAAAVAIGIFQARAPELERAGQAKKPATPFDMHVVEKPESEAQDVQADDNSVEASPGEETSEVEEATEGKEEAAPQGGCLPGACACHVGEGRVPKCDPRLSQDIDAPERPGVQ